MRTKKPIEALITQFEGLSDWWWQKKVMQRQNTQVWAEIIWNLHQLRNALKWTLSEFNLSELIDDLITEDYKKGFGKEWTDIRELLVHHFNGTRPLKWVREKGEEPCVKPKGK
jgi:hypothetical protein